MRNPRQGGGSSRRRRRGPDRPGTPPGGSPYDFAAENEEQVDPVDLLAIRADDELLDALAAGRPVGMAFGGPELDRRFDTGYNDDQQVLAMLQSWRTDVEAEPFPELISVEEASEAIVAGQRAARPRRRLVPVAAAAAAVVLALSGVAIGASNAQPGDPLWGVSTLLNGNRAKSVEAAYRVNLALTTAQQALAEGRPADARAALADVGPELQNVTDEQRKDELSRKSTNLMATADVTTQGEKVETRDDGSPKDTDKREQQQKWRQSSSRSSGGPGGSGAGESGSGSSSGSPGSGGSEKHGGGGPVYDPRFGNPMPGVPGYPSQGSGSSDTNPGFPGMNPGFPGVPGNPGFPGTNPSFPGFPGAPGFPSDPRSREIQKPSESSQPSQPERSTPESKPSESQRPAPEEKPPPASQKPAPESGRSGPESKPATDTTRQPSNNGKQSSENGRQHSRSTEDSGGNSTNGGNNGGGGNNNNGGGNTNGGGNGGGGDQHQQGGNDKPRGQSRGGGGHAEGFMAPVRPFPTQPGPGGSVPAPQNHGS